MAKQTFTAAQVLTAAQMNALQSNDFNQTVTTKTASYTPTTAVDAGTRLVMNAAGATTITINTSIYSAGDTLTLLNIGAGVCTLTAGTCTISSAGPLAIPQYGGGTLFFSSASAAVYFPSAGPAASSGLTLIAKTTCSGASSYNLTNVFSSAYDHYSVRFTDYLGDDISLRYGTSGTPDTALTYMNNGIYIDSTQVLQQGYGYNDSASDLSIYTDANGASLFLEISSPFLTKRTTYHCNTAQNQGGTQLVSNYFLGIKNTATSYTDLVFFGSTTFSFVVSIYGMANS